jgi:hypothetical protein
MKLRTGLFVATVAFAAFPSHALAQSGSSEPRFGLGLSIADVGELVTVGSDNAIVPTIVPGVLIPINVTSHVRLEAEIGGYRNSSTLTQTIPGAPVQAIRTDAFFRIGTGAFWLTTKDRVTIYYGGRILYLRYTQSSTISARESVTYPTTPGKSFAPTVGAEYRLSDHFRLGGEVQVRFVSWDTTSTGVAGFSSTITGNSTSTHGALMLRFFF